MSRLRIENLRFQHLGPIALVIEPSQCVSLTGPSGAGKSLMLRAIADLDDHQGLVYLDGRESRTMEAPQWRRQVAMVVAESQWWRDTVGDHFSAGAAENRQFAEEERQWRAMLGFDRQVMDWEVCRLSTGERQRLALLRTLHNRPRVLLLDEPTASLDSDNRDRVENLIALYRRATGAAVLWVGHDRNQLKRVADKHYRLENGLLVGEEPWT